MDETPRIFQVVKNHPGRRAGDPNQVRAPLLPGSTHGVDGPVLRAAQPLPPGQHFGSGREGSEPLKPAPYGGLTDGPPGYGLP